jgi:hypothetical protein
LLNKKKSRFQKKEKGFFFTVFSCKKVVTKKKMACHCIFDPHSGMAAANLLSRARGDDDESHEFV